MTIPATDTAFDELISFLAATPTTEEIVAYKPPDRLQTRMSELLTKNRNDQLTAEEAIELDEFLRMNRFMSRLQAEAKLRLNRS